MYANRDISANYRPLLQIERLMSDREMFVRAEDLSVFTIPGGRSRGGNERCPLTSNFDAKNSGNEAERAFELPYFSPRQVVIKIIVQGGNTDK